MAKKYIVYASGKDLAVMPVTQNDVGVYYRNSAGTYYKPVLAKFDNATPPTGYKKYTQGSHAKYASNINRSPIDFSIVAGANITMNKDVNVLGTNPVNGSWCKVQPVGSDLVIAFVHTYQWRSGLVKAGNIICKIAPQSVTGFAPHLHLDEWSNKGRKIRELILSGDIEMGTFKIGDKIEFTAVQNIRKGSGTSYTITGQTKIGQVAEIEDGPREADNYTWWDIKGADWVADVGKFKHYVAPVPTPDAPDCSEYKEKIILLGLENDTLKTKQGALEVELKEANEQIRINLSIMKMHEEAKEEDDNKIKLLEERVGFLEATMAVREKEFNELESDYNRVVLEKAKYEQMYIECVTELNALKEGRDDWINKIADVLHKLFGMNK